MKFVIRSSREKLFEQPIEDLNLSIRAMNCVKLAKIRTIGDLITYSRAEMLQYKNFGQKSIFEVEDKLKELGVTLKNSKMKLEIIKESRIGSKDWYRLEVDGKYVTGSWDLKDVEDVYEKIKNGEEITLIEILKSEEIDVSLPETN